MTQGHSSTPLDSIKALLGERAEELACELLRHLTKQKSSRNELRFGTNRSLSVSLANRTRGLWYDHETGEGGGMLNLIMRENKIPFVEAVNWAKAWLGITDEEALSVAYRSVPARPIKSPKQNQKKSVYDFPGIEADCQPGEGTLVEIYLSNRGITLTGRFPSDVLFHPNLPHTDNDGVKTSHPAMVARIRDVNGKIIGLHRTYLSADGTAKATVSPNKKSLGETTGGLIFLTARKPLLAVAEGIETALSIWMARPDVAVVAAISANGMPNFLPPAGVEEVIFCADHDLAKGKDKKRTGIDAARAGAKKCYADGYRAKIAVPLEEGQDFNDVLQTHGIYPIRDAIANAREHSLPPFYEESPVSKEEASLWLRMQINEFMIGATNFMNAHSEAAYEREQQLRAIAWDAAAEYGLLHDFSPELEKQHLRAKAAIIRRIRRKTKEKYGLQSLTKAPRMQICAPAGLGKTHTVIDILINNPDLRDKVVWFLVPTTALGEQLLQHINTILEAQDHSHLKVCMIYGRNKDNCERFPLVEQVGKSGAKIKETLCKKDKFECKNFQNCPYYKQKDDKPGIYIMTHDRLFNPGDVAPEPDLVIVDEAHWRKAVSNKPIAFHPSLLDKKFVVDADEAQKAAFNKVMAILKESIASPQLLKTVREKGMTAEDLKVACQFLDLVLEQEENAREPLHPGLLDSTISRRLTGYQPTIASKLRKLLTALKHEIMIRRDQCHGIRYQENAMVKIDDNYEVQSRISLHNMRDICLSQKVPVLLIDASADLTINRRLWGDHLVEQRIAVERNADITQITGHSFWNGSLLDGADGSSNEAPAKLRNKLAAAIKKIPGKKLVVCTKKAELGLVKVLQDDESIVVEHFNNLRGRNDFKDIDAVIVIGREQPPHTEIENLARAFFATDEEPLLFLGEGSQYPKQSRRYRGTLTTAEVAVHPDLRIQAFLEQIREREIEQALDRLRLIHNNEPKVAYLLNKVVVNVTINEVTSWNELSRGETRLELALKENRFPVFPFYPEWLFRNFSRIWSSTSAAKKDLQRTSEYVFGDKSLLEVLLGFCPQRVKFRIEGKSGRYASMALVVDPDCEDIAAALEEVIGKKVRLIAEDEPVGDED